MNTKTIFSAIISLTAIFSTSAFAQFDMSSYYATQQYINQMSAQNAARANNMMRQLQQEQQQRISRMEQMAKKTIENYRRQTGDTTSSDQQIYNKLVQNWRRNNPEAYAAQQRQHQSWSNMSARMHQDRMRSNQARFQSQQATYRDMTDSVNRSYQSIYRTQRDSSDRTQARTVDMIHGRGNYTNGYGQTVKLPNYDPRTVTHDPNGGVYFQSTQGQHYFYKNGTVTKVDPRR